MVTVFGGTAELYTGSDDTQPKLADTTLLHFSECTSDIHTVYIRTFCISLHMNNVMSIHVYLKL